MPTKNFQRIFLILQIATVCVFFGRGWQHIMWDAPFRTLLWDEEWMSILLPYFTKMSYDEFISSMEMDDAIQNVIAGIGWFYVLCGFSALLIKKIPRWMTYILWLGTLSLMFLAFLYCKEKFYQWGQFWEYSLQFGAPLFLFFMEKIRKEWNEKLIQSIFFWMKIAIAITFISHGLYALNYYPRPGHFTDMVINILGVSESAAHNFLFVAGVLDFILAIGLFLPNWFAKLSLAYAFLWGLATTLARIWAHFYVDMIGDSLSLWAHEFIFRVPHFLVPLIVLIWIFRKPRNNSNRLDQQKTSAKVLINN